jgi:exosome complex RNA-binding protein Csl4
MMGFKDVHDAPFTGYVYDTIPYFANNSYIRPDWYNVRVEFNNGTCAPSQSAYELSFMVKYPSWILEQNWNDVVAVLNADYNGGYDFKQFDWFVNDKLFSENSKSYLYAPQYFHNGDMVYAQLTRSNEDYPICTCPIVLRDMSAEYVSEEPILISVNKIQRKLRIFTQEKLTGGIYDIYGHLMQPFSVMQAGESYVTIHNANSGVYIVKCTSATKEQSYKFVL